MKQTGATLYVVATPLGNLGDLSPRAREVLSRVGLVLAEDTRRAGLLFQRLGIPARGFVSLHDHNEEQRIPAVLAALGRGEDAALISDAGTPLLSDPGYRLVRACREADFRVSPVPGPSAPAAALSACGLPPLPFTFLGFLPRKAAQARKLLALHAATGATLVLFERKDRVAETLALAAEVLGDREFCLARELTKDYEEFLPGRLCGPAALPAELRGEITLVIGPAEAQAVTPWDQVLALVREESRVGVKPKEAARRAAARVRGWTAKAVYEKILALDRGDAGGPQSRNSVAEIIEHGPKKG